MNFKTTIFLLILLIALAAFYVFIESKNLPNSEDGYSTTVPSQEGTPLFTAVDFPTPAVSKIKIENAGTEATLSRVGTDWVQTAPVQFDLNSWSARQIGETAATLRWVERYKPNDKNGLPLNEVGLNPPKAVVTIYFDESGPQKPHTIHLGNKLALGNRGYMKIEGTDQFYVVAGDLHDQILDKSISDLRSKSFDVPAEGKVTKLALMQNGISIETLKAGGNWSFSPPNSGRVSQDAIKKLIEDFGRIYIQKFVTDDPQDLSLYGLAKPQLTLSVWTPPASAKTDTNANNGHADTAETEKEKDQPMATTLRIGGPDDFAGSSFFATLNREDEPGTAVFTIARSDKENLEQSVDNLRDPRLTPIERSDIRELTFNRRNRSTFKLLHSRDGWKFGEPTPPYDVDDTEANKLVDALIEKSQAESYETNIQTGEEPIATVTIAAIGRPEPDILKIRTDDNSTHYLVQRNHETTAYRVPVDELKLIFEPTLAFRSRRVLDLTADNVHHLVIQWPDGSIFDFSREPAVHDVHMDTTNKTRPWVLEGQDRFESGALDELLSTLLPLQAERWHDKPASSPQALTINLATTQGGKADIRIDPQSRIGLVTGDLDGTFEYQGFEISQDLYERLKAEFRYRTVLEMTIDQINQVTIEAANGRLTIAKDDAGQYTSDTGRRIDQAGAGILFDTLAGLRAVRFIEPSTGQPEPEQLARIRIETKDGHSHQCIVYSGGQSRIGKRWFIIDSQNMEKLTKDLESKEPEAIK
ncbi:MAG: hypothetical protein CMJ20_12215 [Phycisphaeraceae bacterium]|nr:hypothetical protein [Phycisphaeraceae bacterium]